MSVKTRQIGPCFAAEVEGVDLGRPLSRDDVAAIHAGMDTYAVLVFHDQQIDDAQQLAFTQSLGPIEHAIGTSLRAPDEYRLPTTFADVSNLDKDNQVFRELCALTETDAQDLRETPFKDKRDFLGFFEEVALMTNSCLIREAVAHYMFGYYAIRCWESRNFWHGVNRESPYWSLFRDFVERMKAHEAGFKFNRDLMRF